MDPEFSAWNQEAIAKYLQTAAPEQHAVPVQHMASQDPQIDMIANLIQESQQRGLDQMRGPIAPEIMDSRRQMMPQGTALDERMPQQRIAIGNPDKWSRTYNR